MRCPICQGTLTPSHTDTYTCTAGHTYTADDNGVLVLMTPALLAHVAAIELHRAQAVTHLPTITDYNALPCALADQHFEWRLRCAEVRWLQAQLQTRKPGSLLEIGAWNGWLTHHLAQWGYSVTAIDYTAHPHDGLGARTRYDGRTWQAIQMNVADLRVLDSRYDVVVVNHGLHLFPDPVGYIAHIIAERLAPGGVLVMLGLTFFRDASMRRAQVAALAQTFEAAHGVPFFFHPTRAYLDFEDKARLQELGLNVMAHPAMRRANLKARVRPAAPAYFLGRYVKA
ncbi:MAG: hypothetical protein OHK0046_20130 [Anaerolineae bacterium]